LPYLRCGFLYHDVSKAGLKRLRRSWQGIKGLDLLIPNKASALILRDKIYPGSLRRGLFENIALFEGHPHRNILNELFYRIIETRGLAGQWIRGEVTYEVFEDFTGWLRGHLYSLSAAFGCKDDLDQAARRISDTAYLFNFLDASSIREGLMDSRLNREFEEFFVDFRRVITPGNGKFLSSWQGLLLSRWDNFSSVGLRREYLKERLGRFRKERRDIGEPSEEIGRIIDSLSPQALAVFFDNIRYLQGWYVESATFGLMADAQIKVIALALSMAKRKELDMEKPFHINFFKLMRLLSSGRHEFDPYKTRILEAMLKDISLEDILLNTETAEPFDRESLSYQKKQPLGAVSMVIDGQKAISFDFSFSAEANKLLELIYMYEQSSLLRHQQALNMLLDLLGLRRDQFDRVGNQDTYMKAMASSWDDKARLLSYGKGPVWVDIGPADGPTLEIAQKLKCKKGIERILAIEISQEAIKALNKRKTEHNLSLITAVRGDACELRELLRKDGIASADTIVFSSVLHEIYSYSRKDGRLFNLDSIRDVLAEALLALSGGGRLLIRDGVIPEDGEEKQILELRGETNKEVFDYFVRHFPGRDLKAAYQVIDDDRQNQLWRIIIKRKDAMEFLFKLTWCWRPEFNPCTFWDEVKEQYGVLTRKGYLGLLYEIANEQCIDLKEIPLPKEEQSYLQPGYIKNLKGKSRLLDLAGNQVSLPDSNMMIVMEKTGPGITNRDVDEGALKHLHENTLAGLSQRTNKTSSSSVEEGIIATVNDLLDAQEIFRIRRQEEVYAYDYRMPVAPYRGDYILACGQYALCEYLKNFRLSDEDIALLGPTGLFDGDFLGYLGRMSFMGRAWMKPEGSLVRANEPVIRIEAPKIQLEIIKTAVKNILGFQSLIATKSSRIIWASRGRPVAEFGLRRAQGEAGLFASRSAFIAGAVSTSNVYAGKALGLPLSGTMAHSYVMSHLSELEAFRSFGRVYQDKKAVLLIDTYNTIEGAKKALIVAKELSSRGKRLFAVRLDSGDLNAEAKAVRRIFDDAGYDGTKQYKILILASGDLDEYKIKELLEQDAPIDGFGVGTNMVTGGEQAILEGM